MGTGRWFWSWRAALVAVCTGATVSACGIGHAGGGVGAGGGPPVARTPASHAPKGNGVVPWASKHAPKFHPAAATTPTPPVAEFGSCVPAHLTAHSGKFGMGTGSSWHSIVLTNTGTKACTLKSGPSRLVGIRADGSTRTLATSAVPASAGNLIRPANLKPGQSVQVEVITSMNCPASQAGKADEYVGVGIGVGAGEVRARFAGDLPPFDAICGASVTGFGVPGTATDVVSSPLDVLTASVAMPGQVTAGATVTYQVTLANPAARAVPLSPCPSYDEFMTSVGIPPIDEWYYLNCATVSQIPADGSVTFDIEVPAPDAAGQAKFGWSLQETSVTAGGVTTVTGG